MTPKPNRPADPIWSDGESLLDRLESHARQTSCSTGTGTEELAQLAVNGLTGFAAVRSAEVVTVENAVVRLLSRSPTSINTTAASRSNSSSRTNTACDLRNQTAAVAWSDPTTLIVGQQLLPESPSNHRTTIELSLQVSQPQDTESTAAIEELSQAILSIVSRSHLQSELQRLRGGQNESPRWIEQLYAGSTLEESIAAIASVIAEKTGCERVAILQSTQKGYRLIATSTQSNVDRRSRQVRLLENAVTESIANQSEFKLTTSHVDTHDRVAGDGMDLYLSESGTQAISIQSVPHRVCATEQTDTAGAMAAIVMENFRSETTPASLPSSDVIQLAIQRSLNRNEIPFPQLFAHSFSKWAADISSSRKLISFIVASVAAAAFLFWFPATLHIHVNGTLQAAQSANVFAPTDASTQQVLVNNGQSVKAGDPLIQLRSAKLDLLNEQIRGDLATAQTELSVAEVSSTDQSRNGRQTSASSNDAANQASAATKQTLLQARIQGLQQQLAIVQQQRDALTLRSPIDGLVDRWDLNQTFLQRPVMHGEQLLTVVAPDQGWKVILDIADSDAGYVIAAQSKETVECHFRLASDSQQTHVAPLSDLSSSSQLNDQGQTIVRGTIHVPDSIDSETFRLGATVDATLNCGRRCIGFVWFRSLIQWTRRQSWW